LRFEIAKKCARSETGTPQIERAPVNAFYAIYEIYEFCAFYEFYALYEINAFYEFNALQSCAVVVVVGQHEECRDEIGISGRATGPWPRWPMADYRFTAAGREGGATRQTRGPFIASCRNFGNSQQSRLSQQSQR
jgi:hypothetical protein